MRVTIFHVLISCVITLQASAQERIVLNQCGFYPRAQKTAIITGHLDDGDFYIINTQRKDTVFKGRPGPEKRSANSATLTRAADFSSLQVSGTYQLYVPGAGTSYPFVIREKVLNTVAVASLKGYYYQRASMPLEEKYAGKWHRAAGHPDTAVIVHASAASSLRPAGTKIASPGGWYDAGDYNKYVVNSGISTATLLSAWEDFPAYYDTLHTNIPEDKKGVPDILQEALYNLRWMLTMQDPEDGGVYHKCTNAAFDGMIMPDAATQPRYVVQKGTAASLDLAAVAAQAVRVFTSYGKQYPGLADSCRKAALLAYKWALVHPAVVYDQDEMNLHFSPKIVTGGYGDAHLEDEFFWAASELYTTTGEEQYYTALQKRLSIPVSLSSWGNVYLLGYYTLLRNAHTLHAHADIAKLMQERVLQLADHYLAVQKTNAFATVMGGAVSDFNWGSNANAANQGVLLLYAYRWSHNAAYAQAALTNLDYLLGRNATGYCFVTGLGSRSTMHPHHRPSIADGVDAPVPGLLAGGPNPGMQDHEHYAFTEPETAYTDNSGAYASNEIAINWNAPLVYLAGGIEALQYTLGYSPEDH